MIFTKSMFSGRLFSVTHDTMQVVGFSSHVITHNEATLLVLAMNETGVNVFTGFHFRLIRDFTHLDC